MKTKNLFMILGASVFLLSCANIARGLVTPNQCKECAVINTISGDTLQKFSGCGSSNVRIYEDAAVYAYEQGCNTTVVCRTWKLEE